MRVFKNEVKLVLLIFGLAIYLTFMFANFAFADPQGASVNFISSSNYTVTPESQTHKGGTINTVTLSVDQQDNNWKAYVGNITGTLVLRNSDGWSIFEWGMNSSTMTGNIYVSRNDSVLWANLHCANNTIINSEQTALGISNTASDSINNTFNYSIHQTLQTTIGGVGDIANGTCLSTATWVNGSTQTMTESAYFQEILVDDTVTLVYATFISQDAWSYNNNESVNGTNVTYDFQIIVAENSSLASGTAYYFYAEVS